MWFKNLTIYQFSEPFTRPQDEIEEALNTLPFTGCGNYQPSAMGWSPPLHTSDDSPLLHSANGRLMVCLSIEERLLPSKVINQQLDEKVAEIQEKEDRKVYRKEKTRIKDELIYSLLPQAFTQTTKLYAYIEPELGLLIVDTSSTNKAELLLTHLRKSLGSLKVTPLEMQNPDAVMTAWLQSNDMPDTITITDNCTLHHPQHVTSVIRCKGEDVFRSAV